MPLSICKWGNMAHIRIRGKKKALYVRFWFEDVEYQRPTGHYCIGNGTSKCTCKQCKLAKLLANEIERKVLLNEFEFEKYFPEKEKKRPAKFHQAPAAPVDIVTDVEQFKYGVYVKKWLKLMETAIAYSSWESYKGHISATMKFIGADRDIRSFVYSDVQELVSHLKEKKLAIKTIRNYVSTFSNLFKSMIKDQILKVNPAADIILKNNTTVDDDEIIDFDKLHDVSDEVFNAEQVLMMLDYAKANFPHMALYFAIGFYRGPRSGEILALTANDIDIPKKEIRIWKTRTARRLKLMPKTKSSVRALPIEDELMVYIKDHTQYVTMDGRYITPNKDLFLTKFGTPYKSVNSIVNQYWTPMINALGLPYRRPYFMRHTFACLMIDKGVNLKTIARIMGHRDLNMILKIYGNKIIAKVGHDNYMSLLKESEEARAASGNIDDEDEDEEE